MHQMCRRLFLGMMMVRQSQCLLRLLVQAGLLQPLVWEILMRLYTPKTAKTLRHASCVSLSQRKNLSTLGVWWHKHIPCCDTYKPCSTNPRWSNSLDPGRFHPRPLQYTFTVVHSPWMIPRCGPKRPQLGLWINSVPSWWAHCSKHTRRSPQRRTPSLWKSFRAHTFAWAFGSAARGEPLPVGRGHVHWW